MGLLNAFFIYLLVWWVVLFGVLPMGVERNSEDGKGHDAGAPVKADLKKKLVLTSVISLVIVVILYVLVEFDVITWGKWFREDTP